MSMLAGTLAVSAAAHAAAWVSLRFPPREERVPESLLLLELAAEPAVVMEPAKEPAALAPAEDVPVVRSVARELPAPAARTETTPALVAAAEPSAPFDMTSVMLSNAPSGFEVPSGSGTGVSGSVGAKRATSVAAIPQSLPAKEPPVVPLADLSVKPKPPALDEALRGNYPEMLRRRGIGGSASIKARIDADGVIRRAAVMAESLAGFGEACRKTVLLSRWSAPRDRSGKPVATEIHYTCRFVVEP
jgi:outer membrane biosynthesis protein TonB